MLKQATLPLVFRDFFPSDYERLVEIYNANFPDYPTSVEETRYTDESTDRTKYYQKRFASIASDSGMPVGFGRITHSWWNFHPEKYFIDVQVDPAYQGRGVGSRIYEKIAEDLDKLHAITAWAWALETMHRSLAFAEKRGFVETKRMWESRLNPQEFDAERFRKYVDRTANEGIRTSTLTEEKSKGQEALKAIYELDQDCWADVPLPVPYTRISYEQWEAKQLRNPSMIPDGYFVASDGPDYVGYSCVSRLDKEPRALFQWMTGVRRGYRGRGIAVALKLRVIDFARRNGYEKILTTNDSENEPMLAVNMKLGFKRQVGWITMEKKLA